MSVGLVGIIPRPQASSEEVGTH